MSPTLLAPLVIAQGAEIEAYPVRDFLTNPTVMTRGLLTLHQALGIDVITVCAADSLEAEALGADLDWSEYPPAVVSHPAAGGSLPGGAVDGVGGARLEVAVEVTRRLAATAPPTGAIAAALTGPLTLCRQLAGPWFDIVTAEGGDETGELLEAVGRVLLDVGKRLLGAGVNIVALVEDDAPGGAVRDRWSAVVSPLANVARFHQAACVVIVEAQGEEDAGAVPSTATLCRQHPAAVSTRPSGAVGQALSPDVRTWPACSATVPIVITRGAVSARHQFSEVREACRRLVAGLTGR